MTAYDAVVRAVREELHLGCTGRPAKSTSSIVEKLRRESIRLTQMQDIAGCRIVVSDASTQQKAIETLVRRFPTHALIDRRARSSHGYRAVHVVVTSDGKQVEIQLRTVLQHQWAELSEKLSDMLDPTIKYGGGDTEIRAFLSRMAAWVAAVERREQELDGTIPPAGATDLPEVESIASTLRTSEDLQRAKVDLAIRLWSERVLRQRGS